MTKLTKGTLLRLFDAVVNAPKDAAYGLLLPTPDADCDEYKPGMIATGALGAATMVAGFTVAPIGLSVIGGFFAARAGLWLAAQGRDIRRGLGNGPQ
ncbi:hypothetical protein [Micavibrio aeruginosavorus]|uniref:Uncharacterized protein n=1 Tax=Micavibrio aeruginosavorus (strain ARL-13) TaxID=856793 RepID=G2KR37_MICAA|nr:hypothetical protein [Micavibrio aeruginosavorus]AEP08689.1 hypothetical protein MICA_344 [Micavibrio aeruginosavorus ARL-13]